MSNRADIIIVGGGLAGLTAAVELGDRGKRGILLDQEPAYFSVVMPNAA